MAIFDVVLNTDEISVLSTPTSIDLSLDYGAKGERGSKIFAGSGDPNTDINWNSIELYAYDLFINVSAGSKYSWLYQYVSKPAGYSWETVLKLNPSIYSTTVATTFTAGSATISIPLSSIVADITYNNPAKYIVQLTPNYTDIISFVITSKSVVSNNLVIALDALVYNSVGSTWSDLANTVNFNLTITVV